MAITVEGEGTLTFWWKVDSKSGSDYLQFLVDGATSNDVEEQISGDSGCQQINYTVTGSGLHTFLWQYVKDDGDYSGKDCGWVDCVEWTDQSSANYDEATYIYDPSGRRIEKDVDGDTTTYIYDGGNVIAEYNDAGSLSKKFIHGGGIDELVCMIDVENSSAVYYYHYDGLGSVVALTNSSGNSCQSYQYSAYGQVAASDPEFRANPYMFTGRRFDYDTGLYYYRARYYNPYIGRFLQTDPVGYGDGINWYAYCGNNPLNFIDPSGTWVQFPGIIIDPNNNIFHPDPSVLGTCWSWWDYFVWYFAIGGGRGVDLDSDTGLLEHIKKALKSKIDAKEEWIISEVNKAWADVRGEKFTVVINEIIEYDFSAWELDPPLGVLGGGEISVYVTGVVNEDGTYHLDFMYTIDDPFDGVLSGIIGALIGKQKELENITGELEIPGGTAYDMTAEWYSEREGKFQ
ncbi:MAG: hypothetical protein JW837_01960 [Sedimentisphaerales bacterium]|nr:hypothetical protein [Sedimentisphaerales bacterium]